MEAQTIQALLNAAVRAPTDHTRRDFPLIIYELTNRLSRIEATPRVGKFQPVTIQSSITSDESLDLGKSMPEFMVFRRVTYPSKFSCDNCEKKSDIFDRTRAFNAHSRIVISCQVL